MNYHQCSFTAVVPRKDKNQDIEVEPDEAGNVTGFIVAGLTAGQERIEKQNCIFVKS